jgi:hypothetical protein
MWRPVVAMIAAALAGACLRHTSYSACKQSSDCAAAGANAHCEPDGACSVDDPTCPSGRRYSGSAPNGAVCVAGGSIDTAMSIDSMPLAPGRECVTGLPLPSTYSTCAAMVDAKEARCGTEQWDPVCVRWVEQLCQLPCSQMAFVGANQQPFVMRLVDGVILWQDSTPNNDGAVSGNWADYDNDGDPDLAISGDTLLRIFKNTGYDGSAGKLVLQAQITVNWATINPSFSEFQGTDVQWVDYDHDGDLDAVFAGHGGLIELRNDGNDVFVPQTPLWVTTPVVDGDPDSPNIIRTAWGDYDRDGWPDLALTRFGHPTMIWHNDHGALSDTGWVPNPAQGFGGGVEWCNVDAKDPEPELVTSGYSYVAINDNTAGVIATTSNTLNSEAASDVECADFDGDGDLDIVVSGDDNAPARAYTNHGTIASFVESWRDTNTATDMIHQWYAAVGDIDGDHVLDFIASGNEGNTPAEFQLFHGTSIANKVQFNPTTHGVLAAQVQSAETMAVAPAIGH